MRKTLITLAAAASALAIASPASAQYYPQPQPNYGYGQGYSQGYRGQDMMRHNQVRLSQLQAQIRHAAMRRQIDQYEAQRLDRQVQQLRQELRYSARNGMSGAQAAMFDRRIDRLTRQLQARAGYGGRNWNGNYGGRYDNYGAYQNGYGYDRDRDHRDDRDEDDRRYDRDDD